MAMYIFIAEKKQEVLSGRTITYLAKNRFQVTPEYLTQVLNGTRGCSKPLAFNIAKYVSEDATIEDYFKKRGE